MWVGSWSVRTWIWWSELELGDEASRRVACLGANHLDAAEAPRTHLPDSMRRGTELDGVCARDEEGGVPCSR